MNDLNELEENIESYIKNKCSWCNHEIPGTLRYYMSYGNACYECNARFVNHTKGVKERFTGKDGKKYMVKIREFTKEEREKELINRINEVKEQYEK